MAKTVYTPGICAHCGSDRVIYSDPIIDEVMTYPYVCEDCGKKGEEIYDILFSYNEEVEA